MKTKGKFKANLSGIAILLVCVLLSSLVMVDITNIRLTAHANKYNKSQGGIEN